MKDENGNYFNSPKRKPCTRFYDSGSYKLEDGAITDLFGICLQQ